MNRFTFLFSINGVKKIKTFKYPRHLKLRIVFIKTKIKEILLYKCLFNFI